MSDETNPNNNLPETPEQPPNEPIPVADSVDVDTSPDESENLIDEVILSEESSVDILDGLEDADYNDIVPDREVILSELNLSHEDATLDVVVTLETTLEESPDIIELSADDDDDESESEEINIDVEDATMPVSIIHEEALADLNKQRSEEESTEGTEEEEIVIKDFLNEDDGESLADRDYLKPPEPEWKVVARQLREDREAERRALIEKRREQDERVAQERKEYLQERDATREQQETEYRETWEKCQKEKKEAVNDMMQRIREERERKIQERMETDERELGQRFSYPKPQESTSYPKPSEIRRMEREQPQNEVSLTDTNKPSPPLKSKPEPKRTDDIDLRISRLSKPDTPQVEALADDDAPDEPTTDKPPIDETPSEPSADAPENSDPESSDQD